MVRLSPVISDRYANYFLGGKGLWKDRERREMARRTPQGNFAPQAKSTHARAVACDGFVNAGRGQVRGRSATTGVTDIGSGRF